MSLSKLLFYQQYSIESDKCERKPFEPETTCVQEYFVTKYQTVYFVSNSIQEAKEKLRLVDANVFLSLVNPLFIALCFYSPKGDA